MSNSVFVKKNDKCKIKFFVKVDDDGISILSPNQLGKEASLKQKDYDECNLSVTPLNWGTICNLQSESHIFDHETGKKAFDGDRYMKSKLRALIVEWDFTYKDQDGDDISVEVSDESVSALHSLVGDYILKEYNKRFEMSEDDRKNS
jgi:hypothetical protein